MAATARAEMVIRRPVDEVFEALVKPALLRKYWLKRASAPLGEGVSVDWEFLVPGATEVVTVTRFVQAEQITFEWSNGNCVDIRTGQVVDRYSATVVRSSNRSLVIKYNPDAGEHPANYPKEWEMAFVATGVYRWRATDWPEGRVNPVVGIRCSQ